MRIATKSGEYEIQPDIIRALQIRFPAANVERELLLCALWLEKNPARRPRKALRFVENWMKKVSPKAPMIDIKRAQWWASESATTQMAESLGMKARGNETWAEFRARIADRLAERKTA